MALPTMVSIALAVGLSLWVMYEVMRLSTMQRRHERRIGQMALALVREIVLPDNTAGVPDWAVVRPRLEAAAPAAGILHARLEVADHTPLLLGDNPFSRPPRGPEGIRHWGNRLQVWDTMLLPAADTQLADSTTDRSARLVLALDLAGLTPQGTDRLLLLLLVLGGGGAVILLLAWNVAMRNRNLQLRLATARSGREHDEELALAATGLAHETKNPLGVMRGMAQQIAADPAHPATAQRARNIMEEADIATDRLGDFLQYARIRRPALQPLAAAPQLERVANLVADEFRTAGIAFQRDLAPVLIMADPEMLSQVVLNLLLNSQKHTPAGGRITMQLRTTDAHSAELIVADNGTGIPDELRPNLFKPYVGQHGGHGLGLAIVKRIAEQSGWKITLASRPGQGTTATIGDIALTDGDRP